jgi:hypothetical protein
MQFKVDLRLISDVDTDDHPCTCHDEEETCFACPDEDGEDPCAYDSYCASEGSAVYINEDHDLASTPFASTELIDGSELRLNADDFLLIETDRVEIKFQLVAFVTVLVDSPNEESAGEQCQTLLPQLFKIYNRASEGSDGLDIQTVEVGTITAI